MAKELNIKENIIREIYLEDGGSLNEITQIVETQFEYVAKVMKHGTFEGVLLPYLGKFWAKPRRVQLFNQAMNKKKARENGTI